MAAHRRLGLDRHQIRTAMQRRINQRRAASLVDFGNGWQYATSADAIASEINHACAMIRRELMLREIRRMSFPSRHEHYLWLWRIAWHPRRLRLRIGARHG